MKPKQFKSARHAGYLGAFALFAAASLSSSRVSADQCSGRAYNVEIYHDGNLMVRLVGPGVSINRGILCNVHHQVGIASPEVCRQWYSTLTAANLSGRTATIWLNGAESCNRPNTTVLVDFTISAWML